MRRIGDVVTKKEMVSQLKMLHEKVYGIDDDIFALWFNLESKVFDIDTVPDYAYTDIGLITENNWVCLAENDAWWFWLSGWLHGDIKYVDRLELPRWLKQKVIKKYKELDNSLYDTWVGLADYICAVSPKWHKKLFNKYIDFKAQQLDFDSWADKILEMELIPFKEFEAQDDDYDDDYDDDNH